MSTISNFFTSRATFKVLQALSNQKEPVSLQNISKRTNISMSVTERTLFKLVEKKLIRGVLSQQSQCFFINPMHDMADLIQTIFKQIEQFESLRSKAARPTIEHAHSVKQTSLTFGQRQQ